MKFKSVMRVLLREGDSPIEFSTDEEIISWVESQAAREGLNNSAKLRDNVASLRR